MFCRTASVLLLLGLSIASCQSRAAAAESEPKLSVFPPVLQIDVTPPVAAPGTPRKIVVAGTWPTACAPVSARLGWPEYGYGKFTLGVLLTEPVTVAACATVLTNYRFELEYTPLHLGQMEILVMTNFGRALGKGYVVSGTASDSFARFDTAGAWYDPQTAGSGLMIAHDYGQSDTLFATWQVYEPAGGASRWFSLQQGRWQADGLTWLGRLYESKAAPTAPCSLCPMPVEQLIDRGGVRLVFSVNGASGGLDAALDYTEPSPPSRLSTLRRFLPNRIVLQ